MIHQESRVIVDHLIILRNLVLINLKSKNETQLRTIYLSKILST